MVITGTLQIMYTIIDIKIRKLANKFALEFIKMFTKLSHQTAAQSIKLVKYCVLYVGCDGKNN